MVLSKEGRALIKKLYYNPKHGFNIERVYKEAMTHVEATSIIKNESGSHFDPMVVEAFCSVINEVEEIATRCGESIPLTSSPATLSISKTE